jgi:capsular exopolysaccharide synthesis family protein
VLLGASERPPQVIQVASSQGDEGKTLVTVHTALALAQAGARVLVIDADLHRPRCHRLLGLSRAPGLADVLAGTPLAETLQPVPLAATGVQGGRLDLVAVGGAGAMPATSLAGPALGKALQAARTAYDHILVDSPPLLAVADGLVLAAMADGVLLVIRNETTPRPVVKQAMARLARVGAHVLGAVLNDVDLAAMRDYYGEPYPASTARADAGDAA